MANPSAGKEKGKSAKSKRPTPLKRDIQSKKRNIRNRNMKSRIRTAVRSLEEAVSKGDTTETRAKLNEAYSILDKAAQKGVLKKNATSRKKARLSSKVQAKVS